MAKTRGRLSVCLTEECEGSAAFRPLFRLWDRDDKSRTEQSGILIKPDVDAVIFCAKCRNQFHVLEYLENCEIEIYELCREKRIDNPDFETVQVEWIAIAEALN